MIIRENLKQPLTEVEKCLGTRVAGIEKIRKVYGSNADSFLIKTINGEDKATTYFLKIADKERINEEINGTRLIENFLPTPRIILIPPKQASPSWILLEHVQGELMVEKYMRTRNRKDFELFCRLEKRKEKMLKALHSQLTIEMTYDMYIKSRTNQLFHKRLFGERYQLFYKNNNHNLSKYFDRRIVVNGLNFSHTINQILREIKIKYSAQKNTIVTATMGHGDAHHGNIIVNKKIEFIDNEYADFIPPFMELAKPYYNDFIGTLFFHHHEELEKYFKVEDFKDTGTELHFRIRCVQKISRRVRITRIKLLERQKLVNKKTVEFLSLNDYLVLCHTLTKDPNTYPHKSKLLFLIFTVILAEFDPFNPESIYSFL